MHTQHVTTYQTTIKAPKSKVWEALTDSSIVKQYFFDSNMDTDWKIGSPLRFWGEYEGQSYEDKGEVLSFTPNEELSYSYLSSWSGKEDVPENYLKVSYKVEDHDDGTLLSIEQSNYDAEKAEHSASNWESVIDGLKKIVE